MNPKEPTLIGMLSQGKMGYHFEQRTGSGVQRLENISLTRASRVARRTVVQARIRAGEARCIGYFALTST